MPENSSQERILKAAVRLFARSGFSGVATKDIAQTASVSEGNLFRYFPTKRDLFVAALESELRQFQVRAESLTRIANAEEPRAVLEAIFALIIETVAVNPNTIRLLQFSALEFGQEMQPVYRRHLDETLDVAARSMERWSHQRGLRTVNPLLTILSFVAMVMTVQSYYPLFSGGRSPFVSVESEASAYADLWLSLLSQSDAHSRNLERVKQVL